MDITTDTDTIDNMNDDTRPLFYGSTHYPEDGSTQGEDGVKAQSSLSHTTATPVTLYPQRWYILVLFAMLGFMQDGVWNTWGPLAGSTNLVFGWAESDIALLSNWGPITFIVSTPFFAWLMDVKGLRWAAVVTGILVAGGTGLRCITATNPAATWLIHTGQVLNGFGGPVAMGAAPLLSALWFPAYQRTTATAFIAIMNGMGVAVSFIIGPLLVPDRNSTTSNNSSDMLWGNSSQQNIAETKKDILKLMYIEFGVGGAILLLILLYFPNKPPQPPSITASIERVDFKEGVKQLFRHRQFWILAAPYAISGGVYNCWGSVLDTNLKPVGVSETQFWILAVPYTISGGVNGCWSSVLDTNLKPLGISEVKAGWLGFYSTLAGSVAGLLIAGFADIFKKRMKVYMLVMYSGAAVAFAILTLACQGLIPLSDAVLYPSIILGAICISGATPMFFELCCEATYPIAEGVTNSLLTWLNNVAGFIFLLLMMIPNIGTAWMNWCMTGCILLCIPILCMVKERYTRLDIDIQTPNSADPKTQIQT